jgi:ubiquitin-conjugating enzyme E2 N
MAAPNLEDPLDEAIADHWRKNQAGALKTAREWTINYANQ